MALFGKKNENNEESATAKSAAADAPGSGMIMPGSGGKEGKSSKKTKAKKLKTDTRRAYRVLLRPIISEKGAMLATDNTYLFEVAKNASRQDVANAVDSVYAIMPIKVRLVNVSGKSRQQRNVKGRTADWKKAMVTLPEGKKIDLYEGV